MQFSFLKRLYKNEKGNFSAMAGVSMLMLMMGAGAAVDYSMAENTKSRMQDIADSAVLGASRSGKTDPIALTKIAQDVFKSNALNIKDENLSLRITRGGHIQVAVSGTYDTMILPIFGSSNIPLNVVSESPLGSTTKVDIALVLDTTGSMRGAKLASLKVAATNLVDTLDSSTNTDMRVSVVPFNQYVNVGNTERNAPWINVDAGSWNGCVGSRTAPWHTRADYSAKKVNGLTGISCGQKVLKLTENMATVKNTISGLTAQGWTYIPSGIVWGWRALDGGMPLAHSTDTRTRKIMVLMTDGANTRSKTGMTHGGWSQAAADATTADLCNNVKTDDIEIFTIAYDISSASTKNMMRNCASETNMYFDASNSAQLQAAFDEIGASLLQVRLSH